jgi:hypothetical protein
MTHQDEVLCFAKKKEKKMKYYDNYYNFAEQNVVPIRNLC